MNRVRRLALVPFALLVTAAAPAPADYAVDAQSIEAVVNTNYAYLERFPGSRMPMTPKLRAEAQAVKEARQLVRYSERALALLADHHAITGSSMKDSWAVFPSYGDLWVDRQGGGYLIEQVRDGSPAEQAGIRAGDRLVAVDGQDAVSAVAAFWAELGTTGGGARDGYAARVLAAGRRDRPRRLTVQSGTGPPRALLLPTLYSLPQVERPPLTVTSASGEYRIRFNDSLGDSAAIAAFDAAMVAAPRGARLVIDLRDTPSGGNTTIARAVMGWFVTRPTFYQVHNLPAEERQTGVARQWAEQVLPRAGKQYRGPVTVRVGRWTGSMGEGLAIGFAALRARVEGSRMAGLLGAIYDHRLARSGQVIKLPTERLYTVDGLPRERFVPKPSPTH